MKEKRENPNLEGMIKCYFCGKYIQDKKGHPCYMPTKRQQEHAYKLAVLQKRVEENSTLNDYRSSKSREEFMERRRERHEAEEERREIDSLIRAEHDIKELLSEMRDARRKGRNVKFI